jgi:hypothetical protein
MNGDLILMTVAVMLMFIGGSGIGSAISSFRCTATRDPYCDVPLLFVAGILVFLGCWIAGLTIADPTPLPLAIQ